MNLIGISQYLKPDGTYSLYSWMGEEWRRFIIRHNFAHWLNNPIPLELKEKS